MLAFINTSVSKPAILRQLNRHYKADQIVKGQYWQDGKGCAVACTVHSSDHAEYEPRFGIPQMLASLEDRIFEGLPNEAAKKWPIAFMRAVEPGMDLSCVGWQFLHWILTTEKVNPGIAHPRVRDAVKQCADVIFPLTKGELPKVDAESAAESAWSAAESVARGAESAAARGAAESAARGAWSAWSAARSAGRAESAWRAGSAWSAGRAESAGRAGRAWSAWGAWSAARSAGSAGSAGSAAYTLMADKLLDLIKAAPIRA